MEALNRKPDLSPRMSMTLEDGTKIEKIGLTARKSLELSNNKKFTDSDRGMNLIAAKILVNGAPIVVDDLLDSFTDDEIVEITEFITGKDKEEPEKNGQSPART